MHPRKLTGIFVFLALTAALLLSAGSGWAAKETTSTGKPEESGKAEEASFKQFHTIVDAAVVKEIVDAKTMGVVIDARPKKKKYDKGHIPGALSLPTSKFDKMKGLLPADKDALIVFYCGGLKCALSHKAAFKAEKLGYTNVKVFAKGYPSWKKTYGEGVQSQVASKPAETESGRNRKFKAGKEEGSIDHAAFKEILKKQPDSVLLVDTRDAHEYKTGSFANAVNLNVEELEKKLPSWKVDKPIIFVCGTGARSGEAYYMALDMRPDIKEVYYVDGEISWDKEGGYKLTPAK